MELKNIKADIAELQITRVELLILNNALNEVCNGLDKFDFDTRMGASQEEVSELLTKVGLIIDTVESNTE